MIDNVTSRPKSKKKWILLVIVVALVGIALVCLYCFGYFDPCQDGHTFFSNADGCICIDCGNVFQHEYEQNESSCSCINCGYETDGHVYVKQDSEFICKNCGFAITGTEYLIDFVRENGVYENGYYTLEAVVPFREIERIFTIACRAKENKLYFGFYSEVFGSYDIVSIVMDCKDYKCIYAYESYLAAATHKAEGEFSASGYRAGQNMNPSKVSGPYVNQYRQTVVDMCTDYVGVCVEGIEDVIKDYGIDLNYSDIGFISYK